MCILSDFSSSWTLHKTICSISYYVSDALQNTSAMWAMFVSVAVMTWRVTIFFHTTAAFLFKLGHRLSSTVHDGSDAAVWLAASHWGRKGASWNVIGSYVIAATGRLLLSRGLLNTNGFDMQTSSLSWAWDVIFILRSGCCCLGEWEKKTRQVNDVHLLAWQPWSNFYPQWVIKQNHLIALKFGIIISIFTVHISQLVTIKGTMT